MEMVDVDHMKDFDQVVAYLQGHLMDVINDVRSFDKVLLDNGKTQLNVPPPLDEKDDHGSLLLRTLSEQENAQGIVCKREFKVHTLSNGRVEIREDVSGVETKESRTEIVIQA